MTDFRYRIKRFGSRRWSKWSVWLPYVEPLMTLPDGVRMDDGDKIQAEKRVTP